jgi:hypothetical protein
MTTALVQKFVQSFQKAVRAEMEAMREQLGPFEVPVTTPVEIETPADSPHKLYEVTAEASSDRLVLNGECTLVHTDGEALVTITAIDGDQLTLRCEAELPRNSSAWTLVIYPWFLYERLLQTLEALPTAPGFHAASALTLFGKLAPRLSPTPVTVPAPELNASQQRAVQLCSDSNVAFVWGPPGTGKTRTISHIVSELLAQGQRVLLTSTTNAAIDQALAILATHPDVGDLVQAGRIVRVGQTSAPTFGASLGEVVKRQNADLRQQLEHLRKRSKPISDQLRACEKALRILQGAASGRQLDMFVQVPDDALHRGDLGGIFKYRLANHLLTLMSERKQVIIERRRRRLERANALYTARISACLEKRAGEETSVMANARVVLATMTNMYISKLLMAESFDVVIVEEAGMAILPTLFYCAGLAARKVIAVGDPRQLPPIVVSRDPYVQQAMGRNIFDVTVPDPDNSPMVVMLDTQYRMHPAIGSLVSDLFYGGRLTSDNSTACRSAIAARHPYPGQPLVVVDTQGHTRCTKSEGSFSRSNPQTAELCVRLAAEAVEDGIESVAIITPYAQQSRLISGLLVASAIPEGAVECRTVHRFQGNERDLVILDTVDTLPERPGVLLAGRRGASSAPHLLNVSISRAKGKLVIVADVAYFKARAAGSAIDQVLSAAVRVGMKVGLEEPVSL